MGDPTRYVRAFDQNLQTALSALSKNISMDYDESREIRDAAMEVINNWLFAAQAIEEKWNALNGEPGKAESPVKYGKNGGFFRLYEHGAIYYRRPKKWIGRFKPSIGAHWVYGAIYEKYLELGGEGSFLGYPLTDEKAAADNAGRFNHFEGGSIYWSVATGAHEVHGEIRDKWTQTGWESGILGYPMTDETSTLDGIGRFNHFQHGSIFWTPELGAHEVHGSIRDHWAKLGWERSYLGYPELDEKDWMEGSMVKGRISRFQRGTIARGLPPSVVVEGMPTEAAPRDLPDTVILSVPSLNPPEPITGWAELTINSKGFFSYRGSLHVSGFIGYQVSVASALNFVAPDGAVICVGEETHLGGTVSFDERDHSWKNTGFETRIRDNWDTLKSRGMKTEIKVGVTVGDVVELLTKGIVAGFVAGIAIFAVMLFGSGKAHVCRPHGSVTRDPTNNYAETPTVSIPICVDQDYNLSGDATRPHNCCEGY